MCFDHSYGNLKGGIKAIIRQLCVGINPQLQKHTILAKFTVKNSIVKIGIKHNKIKLFYM
jgi:hypothetical protein